MTHDDVSCRVSRAEQMQSMRRGLHMVVSTPGRLLDMLNAQKVKAREGGNKRKEKRQRRRKKLLLRETYTFLWCFSSIWIRVSIWCSTKRIEWSIWDSRKTFETLSTSSLYKDKHFSSLQLCQKRWVWWKALSFCFRFSSFLLFLLASLAWSSSSFVQFASSCFLLASFSFMLSCFSLLLLSSSSSSSSSLRCILPHLLLFHFDHILPPSLFFVSTHRFFFQIQQFAKSALIQPVTVNVGRAGAASLDIFQEVEYVKEENKLL